MLGYYITQVFNDKNTNRKGHLGYDMTCAGGSHKYTFEETATVSGYTGKHAMYFYGSTNSSKDYEYYPRCGFTRPHRFFDPYGVISTNGAIITHYKIYPIFT